MQLQAQDEVGQIHELQADVSVMHRRNGATVQTYEAVSAGSTIEYSSRKNMRMFRVYSIRFSPEHQRADSVIIESYRNGKLLLVSTPRVNNFPDRISVVDDYVIMNEDQVKFIVLLQGSSTPKEWSFFINFK